MIAVKCTVFLAIGTAFTSCGSWDSNRLSRPAGIPQAWQGPHGQYYDDSEAGEHSPQQSDSGTNSTQRASSRNVKLARSHSDNDGSEFRITAGAPPTSSFKPYTPEWWAEERAKEDWLKKRIIICSNCFAPASSMDVESAGQSDSDYDHDVAKNAAFMRNMNSLRSRATE
jgi:hypothetical protein